MKIADSVLRGFLKRMVALWPEDLIEGSGFRVGREFGTEAVYMAVSYVKDGNLAETRSWISNGSIVNGNVQGVQRSVDNLVIKMAGEIKKQLS